MKVLIACEESQAVCKEFRALGHEAYSCDIQECSGGHPEWHLQVDALELLKMKWDLIIAHPPCTYLTVTGNRWFDEEKYGQKAIKRKQMREEAAEFLWRLQMQIVSELQLKILLDIWGQGTGSATRQYSRISLEMLLKSLLAFGSKDCRIWFRQILYNRLRGKK